MNGGSVISCNAGCKQLRGALKKLGAGSWNFPRDSRKFPTMAIIISTHNYEC